MSHLDAIRSATFCPQSVWLEFVIAYRADEKDLYLFVEGREDVAYLSPLARRESKSGRARVVPCWSKDGVLTALRDVSEKSPHAKRCGFVVDRDLDDLVGVRQAADDKLLVTEYYSLENHITSAFPIEIVWTELWGLSQSDGRLQDTSKHCDAVLASLRVVALPVMAWILWHRRQGSRLNLAGIPSKQLFLVTRDGQARRTKDCLARLRRTVVPSGASEPTLRELLHETRILSDISGNRRTRGKYEIAVLVSSLRMALKAIQRVKGLPQGTPRPIADINENNIVALVAGKAVYPDIFRSFIRRIAADQ